MPTRSTENDPSALAPEKLVPEDGSSGEQFAGGSRNSPAKSLRLIQGCAGAAFGIALLAAAGWPFHMRFLAGQWGGYIPASPTTALALLLLSSGVFIQARWSAHRRSRRLALVLAGLPALLALVVVTHFFTGLGSWLERLLYGAGEAVGLIPVGRMSPLAAGVVLLESGAPLLLVRAGRWRFAATAAVVLAPLGGAVGLVVLVGYAYAAPPMYGGATIPVALPTALALGLVGVGETVLALHQLPVWRAWTGDSTRGAILRAFLPAMLFFVLIEDWLAAWTASRNPALVHSLSALACGALIAVVGIFAARRTGDAIDRAGEALRTSEERNRKILQAALDAFFIVDRQGRFVDASETYCRLIGYGREELLKMRTTDVDAPESQADFRATGSCRFETRQRSKDGRSIDLEISAADLPGAGQNVVFLRDITERKRAEDALRKSEQSLASIYDTVGDVIFRLAVEPQGQFRYVSVNPALLRVTGLNMEMVAGKLVSEVIPEPSLTMVLGKYRQAIEEKAMVRWEETSQYPAGRLTGEVSIAPVFDRQGVCTHLVGSVHDITERKRAENALRESEERFAAFMSNLPAAAFVKDADGRTLFANPYLQELLGFGNWEGKTTQMLIAGEAGQRMEDDNRKAIAQGPLKIQETMLDSHGNSRTFETIEFPIRLAKTTLLGGIATDISERQAMETALLEAETKFRAMFLNGPNALYLASLEDGRISDVNSPFEDLFGYSRGEVLGRILQLGLYANPADRARMLVELKANGRVTDFEIEGRKKGGELLACSLSAVTLVLGGELWIAGAIRDISERKRAEAEREKLWAQLAQAQKMESIGRLAGGVAHDFNNLLTVINGYSQLALAELSAGDPLRDGLEEIHKAGERAAGLTRQLLAFSRKQVLQPRVLDLNRVVEDMRPMLERLVGEDVEVRVALHADSGTVRADPHQLEQVIMNLAVNARDAMPHGGRLLIETADVELDASYARSHPEARAGRYVMLAVSDSGDGHGRRDAARHLRAVLHHQGSRAKGPGWGCRWSRASWRRAAATSRSTANRATGRRSRSTCPRWRKRRPMRACRQPFRRWAGRRPCWWWRTRRKSASTRSRR